VKVHALEKGRMRRVQRWSMEGLLVISFFSCPINSQRRRNIVHHSPAAAKREKPGGVFASRCSLACPATMRSMNVNCRGSSVIGGH